MFHCSPPSARGVPRELCLLPSFPVCTDAGRSGADARAVLLAWLAAGDPGALSSEMLSWQAVPVPGASLAAGLLPAGDPGGDLQESGPRLLG